MSMDWADRAECRDADPELFFPEAGHQPDAAKRICGRCPVQQQCLDHAVTRPERFGVWGGTTEKERGRRFGFASDEADRDARIEHQLQRGVSVSVLAGWFGLSVRHVQRIAAREVA